MADETKPPVTPETPPWRNMTFILDAIAMIAIAIAVVVQCIRGTMDTTVAVTILVTAIAALSSTFKKKEG